MLHYDAITKFSHGKQLLCYCIRSHVTFNGFPKSHILGIISNVVVMGSVEISSTVF